MLEGRAVTYRTRIPGTGGTEMDFESRKTGQATLEAVRTDLPFAGAGAPLVVGNRRRPPEDALGAALGPPREPDAAAPDDTDAAETRSQD